MHLICFFFLFVLYGVTYSDDDAQREQCARTPSNAECLKLKSQLLEWIKKCQKIKTGDQIIICLDIRARLCAVFPTDCPQTIRKKIIKTTRRTTKSKLITTTTTTTTTTSTTPIKVTISETTSNEEFVKVPVNPDELRTRGEYCVRHGKEKKCQQLLNNLKTTYSSCSKKKPERAPTKPEELDCHSFESHMCLAFPKFPPCVKKTPK